MYLCINILGINVSINLQSKTYEYIYVFGISKFHFAGELLLPLHSHGATLRWIKQGGHLNNNIITEYYSHQFNKGNIYGPFIPIITTFINFSHFFKVFLCSCPSECDPPQILSSPLELLPSSSSSLGNP
jgi:hypothetical protein